MLEKIRAQLEEDLGKIHQAVDTSSIMELRERVKTAIADAKKNADKGFQQFQLANDAADQFVDPHLERAVRSKWTALIIGVALLAAVLLGAAIGMNL